MGAIIATPISFVISILIFIIFAQVIIHWLVMFEVLKVNTFQAKQLVNTLNQFTEKMYRPFRRFIPPLGGIDITPIIVIILLQILQSLVWAMFT